MGNEIGAGIGTAQRCDCCGRETMAKTYPDLGLLEIRARTHGGRHWLSLGLPDLVALLDPAGTTVRLIGTGSA